METQFPTTALSSSLTLVREMMLSSVPPTGKAVVTILTTEWGSVSFLMKLHYMVVVLVEIFTVIELVLNLPLQ